MKILSSGDGINPELTRSGKKVGLKKRPIQSRSVAVHIRTRGEREAIILAEELKALLLIDDRPARKSAEKRGIVCFGSLRVLKIILYQSSL